MFVCEICLRSFSRKDSLKRHGNCRTAVNICGTCGGIFKSEGALQRHQREKHPAPKRKAEDSPTSMAKRAKLDQDRKFLNNFFNFINNLVLYRVSQYSWNSYGIEITYLKIKLY